MNLSAKRGLIRFLYKPKLAILTNKVNKMSTLTVSLVVICVILIILIVLIKINQNKSRRNILELKSIDIAKKLDKLKIDDITPDKKFEILESVSRDFLEEHYLISKKDKYDQLAKYFSKLGRRDLSHFCSAMAENAKSENGITNEAVSMLIIHLEQIIEEIKNSNLDLPDINLNEQVSEEAQEKINQKEETLNRPTEQVIISKPEFKRIELKEDKNPKHKAIESIDSLDRIKHKIAQRKKSWKQHDKNLE